MKITVKDRITIRLGPLVGPVARRLRRTGEDYSQYVRRLIAEDLGLSEPEVKRGRPCTNSKSES